MRTKKMLCWMAMAAILLGVVYTVGAQPTEPYPIGEVTIEATQVAAGVGYTWGSGTLKFKGKEYRFKVKGLDVAAVGVAKISAKGDVYNMNTLADFPGDYAAVQAGAAVYKGPVGLLMRNTKGVVINLRAAQTGVQLALGTKGMTITME